MLEMLKAIKHCYHGMGSCQDCPYENDREKCNKLFENIEKVFTTISEYIEFDDLSKIAKIILKEDKDNESEN